MNKYLVLATLVVLSCSQFIGDTQCSCAQNLLQESCTGACLWNGTACVIPTLATAVTDKQCYAVNGLWTPAVVTPPTPASCTAFTSCAAITLLSVSACQVANPGCTWKTGDTTCQPIAACSTYPDAASCNGNVGTDGLCHFGATCLAAAACGDFPTTNCPANRCSLNTGGTACVQAQCSLQTTQATCNFVFNSYNANTITACLWNVTCIEAPQPASLTTAAACSANTDSYFTWSTAVAATGVCKSCGLAPLIIGTQPCVCGNFKIQANCVGSCLWNAATQTCGQPNLKTSTNQAQCNSANGVWNGTNNTCTPFSTCAAIQLNTIALCQAAYSGCTWVTGATCSAVVPIPACSTYAQAACGDGSQGSDGLCYWTGTVCAAATSCSNFTTQATCPVGNACQWSGLNCVAQTCKNIGGSPATAQKCEYVLTSITPEADVIACAFNATNNTCNYAQDNTDLGDQGVCKLNTQNTFTWNNNQCQQCTTPPPPPPLQPAVYGTQQCVCGNYILKAECPTTTCLWSDTTNTCSSANLVTSTNQTQCNLANGFWTAATAKCTPFYTCDQILLTTAADCQSANSKCTWVTPATHCSNAPTAAACSTYGTQLECDGQTGSDGKCYYSGTGCQPATSCANFNSADSCNSQACHWNTVNNTCVAQTCQTLGGANPTAATCTYVLQSVTLNASGVILCEFNTDYNPPLCDYAQVSTVLATPDTCQANSFNTWTWNSNTATTGACAQCNTPPGPAPLTPQVSGNAICTCGNFASQTLCVGSCIWVASTSLCQDPTQFSAYTQAQCNAAKGVWTAATANTSSTCVAFTTCAAIKLNTAADCSAAYSACTWTAGTTCTDVPSTVTKCSSLLTAATCNGQIESDGFCVFTKNAADVEACAPAQACGDFATQAQCNVAPNTCFWNSANKCVAQTCITLGGTVPTAASCTYVSASFNPAVTLIQACAFDNVSTNPPTCDYAQQASIFTTPDSCTKDTANTFTWSTNVATTGACTKCAAYNPPLTPAVQGAVSCSCGNYVLQAQCPTVAATTTGNVVCVWNAKSNLCQLPTLTNSTTQQQCNSATGVWTPPTGTENGTCKKFTSCTDIKGASVADCQAAYSGCTWTTGTTCSASVPVVNPLCPTFTTAATCNGQLQSNGQTCVWNGASNTCIVAHSCANLVNQAECAVYPNACQWTGTLCVQQTCVSFAPTTATCTFISTALVTTPASTWACTVTGTPARCDFAQAPADLTTYQTCLANTGNTFAWSTNDPAKGACKSCTTIPPGPISGILLKGLVVLLTFALIA